MLYDSLRSLMLPLKEIDEALPQEGEIIELGCGEGVISKFIAKNPKRLVVGIDANSKRISIPTLRNLKFKVGDITSLSYKKEDGFVLSDVLHHLEPASQKRLLKNISQALKKNGVIVIKEIDKNEFVRSKASRCWDFILYPSEKINYWNAQNLRNYLIKLGLAVRIQRPCRFFPGSTTLFICKKNV